MEDLLNRIEAVLPGSSLGQAIIKALLTARGNAAHIEVAIAKLGREVAYQEALALTLADGKSEAMRKAEAEVALHDDDDYQQKLTNLDNLNTQFKLEQAVAEAARASLRIIVAELGMTTVEQEQ